MARHGYEAVAGLRHMYKVRHVTVGEVIDNQTDYNKLFLLKQLDLAAAMFFLCFLYYWFSGLQVVLDSRSCNTFDLEDHEHHTRC
jgi:hypothetical protein